MGEAVAAEAVAPQLRPPQAVEVEVEAVEARRPPPEEEGPRRLLVPPNPPRLRPRLRRWSVRVGSATTTAASTNQTLS